MWKLLGEPGRYEPASLLWTRPVLGRKRRESEAFLEEMAAELDCRRGEESVWGRRPRGQGRQSREAARVWPLCPPCGQWVCRAGRPGEVAALFLSW